MSCFFLELGEEVVVVVVAVVVDDRDRRVEKEEVVLVVAGRRLEEEDDDNEVFVDFFLLDCVKREGEGLRGQASIMFFCFCLLHTCIVSSEL